MDVNGRRRRADLPKPALDAGGGVARREMETAPGSRNAASGGLRSRAPMSVTRSVASGWKPSTVPVIAHRARPVTMLSARPSACPCSSSLPCRGRRARRTTPPRCRVDSRPACRPRCCSSRQARAAARPAREPWQSRRRARGPRRLSAPTRARQVRRQFDRDFTHIVPRLADTLATPASRSRAGPRPTPTLRWPAS